MSHASGSSSTTSNARPRGRTLGVPRICWCGEEIWGLISKSNNNPYRRYYRCAYAARSKLRNDDHIFKWVDESLLDEIETLQCINASLELQVKELRTERVEFERKVLEKIQIEVEKEMSATVEETLSEAKRNMTKMMIAGVVGCMVIVGFIKLID